MVKYVLVEMSDSDYRKLVEVSKKLGSSECVVASMLLTYALEKVFRGGLSDCRGLEA
ncbi:MAG: hypothetical protein QXT64_08500 [Desulfurococcaceae archaeon]